FAVIAVWPLHRGQPGRWWALPVSGVFLLLALTYPFLLRPLNRIWTQLGFLLSRVTNPIVIGAMFFVIFTPVAFFCRLLGKDLLRLAPAPGAESYWIRRQPPGPDPESM